jgi:hypothetical protein
MKIDEIYILTVRVLSIGLLITSFEILYTSKYFRKGQAFDWEIIKSSHIKYGGWYARILEVIYSQLGMIILLMTRIIIIILLFFINNHNLFSILLIILTILSLLMYYRQSYGMDGADQINIVTLITVTICFAISSDMVIKKIGIIFLGVHLGFAYFVSGFAKLISPVWRNGMAAKGVLSTYSYGSPLTQELVKKNIFSYFICWFTIAFECLFPFTLLISNSSFVLIWLAIGLFFHLGIAIIMGLNDFIWAFCAGYAAFFYLSNSVLHNHLTL